VTQLHGITDFHKTYSATIDISLQSAHIPFLPFAVYH